MSAVIFSTRHSEIEAISRTLADHGATLAAVTTVEEASDAVRARNRAFDIVFVDAVMETNDGALLKAIRDNGVSRGRAITLIAPTDRGRLVEFRASGYSVFLARPVRGETLLRMLVEGVESARPRRRGRKQAPPRKVEDRRKLRVLIAEDNDINAMLARAALTRAGHKVHLVSDGRAAVDALERARRRYDVVLMDLHMPVMDGLDAITHIRRFEEDEAQAPVPIIVLSADGQEATRHGVLARGATGFLLKPLDPQKLAEAVEEQAA